MMQIMKNTTKHPIYLDHNATSPLKPAVRDALHDALDSFGNASSIHHHGREARKQIEKAREHIASLTDARPANVIFTSGGTESNNTILSAFQATKKIAVLATEHPSVLQSIEDKTILPVDQNGLIKIDFLKDFLSNNSNGSVFLSIQHVNSETGIIQPIRAIADLAKSHGALLHTDSVQAAGRLSVSMKQLGVDFMTLSGHKMGGPQGSGALIAADLKPFMPFLKGGGQERRRRAGTENTNAITGFGVAAQIALDTVNDERKRLLEIKRYLEQRLVDLMPDTTIFGERSLRVCNTTNFTVPDHTAETLLMYFDLNGVSLSSGSACSSGSIEPSHVLTAMGYDKKTATSALRLSMGWNTTKDDIDYFLEKLQEKI
jgi:cysteine desulfurase